VYLTNNERDKNRLRFKSSSVMQEALLGFFEISESLLTIHDSSGYFLFVSDSWTNHTGYSFRELTEKPWRSFIHPDDVDKSLESFEKGKNEDYIIYYESFVNRYRIKTGGYVTLEWAKDYVKSDEGIFYSSAKVIKREEI
jgi:PAS domain S-box-containing protein